MYLWHQTYLLTYFLLSWSAVHSSRRVLPKVSRYGKLPESRGAKRRPRRKHMQYAYDEEQGKVTSSDIQNKEFLFSWTRHPSPKLCRILHNSDPTLSKKESGSRGVDSRKRENIRKTYLLIKYNSDNNIKLQQTQLLISQSLYLGAFAFQ